MCKCGKANQPTRKYCIRCGASLVQTEDEKPAAPTKPAVEPPREKPVQAVPQDSVSPTTEHKWVRPSEVRKDRLRTAERHVDKTEFEKAKEAFAKADSVDMDERMLRASELRELMADGPASHTAKPTTPPTTPVIEESPKPQQRAPKSVPIRETPAPSAPATPQRMNASEPESVSTPTTSPQLTKPMGGPPGISGTSPIAVQPKPAEIKTPAPPVQISESRLRQPAPQVEMEVDSSDPNQDKRVKEIDSDISYFAVQLKQLEEEREEIRTRHEGNTKWLSTVAETKRFRMEELDDSLRRAKEEFDQANKDLKEAENRMKKELSEADKRIDNQSKRIKNAEKAKEKRLKEIEKESSG